MNANQLHEEIKEANLSYMMLAKQMINDDKASAIFRLGISEEMADLLAGLTPAQLLKMAASNMLLCAFRFERRGGSAPSPPNTRFFAVRRPLRHLSCEAAGLFCA